MKRFIFTFGSNHLTDFNVESMNVLLVIKGSTENEAREKVLNIKGVGRKFCTSYPYSHYAKEFKEKYGMKEYTLEELEKVRKTKK